MDSCDPFGIAVDEDGFVCDFDINQAFRRSYVHCFSYTKMDAQTSGGVSLDLKKTSLHL